MERSLLTEETAIRLVEKLLETKGIPLFITMVCREAWRFGGFTEHNRQLFQSLVIEELERTKALEVRP